MEKPIAYGTKHSKQSKKRGPIAERTAFKSLEHLGIHTTKTKRYSTSKKETPYVYELFAKPKETMTTVYFASNIKDKEEILSVKHSPVISLQVIEPIKRSKEPIPEGEIHYKMQGASYDIYRVLYLYGRMKSKIKFLY